MDTHEWTQREQASRRTATTIGVEVGRQRERKHIEHEKQVAWDRGFIIGILVAALVILLATIGADNATARAAKHHQTLGAKNEPHMPSPAIQRAIIRIGQCEQPAPLGLNYYANIRWDAYPGKTWPGGLGIMQVHHERFRAPGTPRDATKATPAQQIRVAWRAYKYYRAEGRRLGYGDGIRYGSTFWVCSKMIGFGGVDYKGRVIWR